MTPIIGRQAEVEALDTFLMRVPHGFACLSLEGEAGVGKTTVWQAGVQRAIDQSSIVLTCRPSQAERELPFSALGDLLDRIDDQLLRRLPDPQRRALEVALLREDAGARPPDQRAIAVSLLSLLRELGKSAHVVVAIDDAQWVDPPTADALRFVARRLETEPVGLLVAARRSDGPACTFDRVVVEGRRQAIRLRGLPIHELHELLSVRLKHVFPRPTLVKIAHASNGNPFYAQEIARELLRAGQQPAGAPLPVPADLRELVAARVRTLPESVRAALLAAAATPHPTTTLLDVDESSLQPAVEAEIVRIASDGRITFAHPLYASAIYESEPTASRRELHRRLAALVMAEEDEHARHLALASSPPDENVARALERGATRARDRGAWQFAAELLEHARAFTPADQPDVGRRRGIAAAEHYAHAGDRKRASTLLEELLAQEHNAPARAQALCLLGQIRYNDESFAEALRLLEEARHYASDELSIANIELDLAYASSQVWDFERTAAHVARALELTPNVRDFGLHAMALAYRVMSEYLRGNGIDWHTVELSVALEDSDRTLPLQRTPSSIHGLLLLLDGRLAEARDRLEFVCQRATERGDESDTAYFLCWLAWLETQAGDLRAAHARADEALLVAILTGSTSMRAFALACRATVSALRGDIELARRECDEASSLAEQTTNGIAMRMIAVARCMAELSVENAAAAWQAAELLLAPLAHVRGPWEPSALLFLPDALDALIALGELDRAAAVLDAFQDRARALDRVWAVAMGERCRGLLLAARGDLSGATLHLQRAVHEHRRLEMPFELARTLLCVGRVERRRKLRKNARAALGQALEIFEQVGAPLWAARAQAELDRTHVREAPSELSPSELRVAELAGSGLTNRQIATQLFLSPKTVEANLARVYGKLGIRSRAELGARMAAVWKTDGVGHRRRQREPTDRLPYGDGRSMIRIGTDPARLVAAALLAAGVWLVGAGSTSAAPGSTDTAVDWLRTVRETPLISGPADPVEQFTLLPPGAFLEPLGTHAAGRLLVYYPGDGRTRLPGQAWVAALDVAPSGAPPWISTSELDGDGASVVQPSAPRRASRLAPPEVTASEVAVVDDATGLLVYGRRAHTRQPPASTTKIVTAMVALEHEIPPETVVTVRINGWAMAEADGSSIMGLTPGTRVSMHTLLVGLLLPSGNDAAEQLAQALGESRQAFVDQMNHKVAELGLENTHFVNPSGLDAAGHYASAYDLARLAREAMRSETFRSIVSTPTYAGDGFILHGHNPLLGVYPGIDGVKTGTTDLAGKVLVASATRDGQRLFVVLMHTGDPVADASALFDWAWSAFTW